MAATILYEWSGDGRLPSLTAACLQAEAYLRFSSTEFHIETCSSSSRSPTGVLPALDSAAGVAGSSNLTDLEAARAIIAQLRSSGTDLDANLSPAQRAEVLAFGNLIQCRLDAATQYTTWFERRGFAEYRKAAYSALPFPLNWVVPYSQSRDMRKHLGSIDGEKAYTEAVEALGALSDRLKGSGGPFLFGSKPSSLDALLFGHVAFYLHSPIAAPVLKTKVNSLGPLMRFVERILTESFSREVPPPPPLDDVAADAWTRAGQGQQAKQKKAPPTAEELRMWRGGQMWMAGAAAAVGAYALMSGQYVQILTVDDDEEDLDDDGDDDVDLE